MITMFDAVDLANMPAGEQAYAGYTGGNWPTFPQLQRMFPGAWLLSIAISAAEDADALDVETGDATIGDIPGWFRRQEARGRWRPVIYHSVSGTDQVAAVMTGNGFPRSSYRLWSAHYQAGEHICGPATCRLTAVACDGTQWTDTALGRSLDQSTLLDGFFAGHTLPPPPPAADWTARMIANLPELAEGAADTPNHRYVARLQGLCCALGHPVPIDGAFGPLTRAAVEAVQGDFNISADGVAGPATWGCLVAGAPA